MRVENQGPTAKVDSVSASSTPSATCVRNLKILLSTPKTRLQVQDISSFLQPLPISSTENPNPNLLCTVQSVSDSLCKIHDITHCAVKPQEPEILNHASNGFKREVLETSGGEESGWVGNRGSYEPTVPHLHRTKSPKLR